MNTFKSAVINHTVTTTNGMKARKTTSSAVVDLFYKIAASRGQNIIPAFVAACVEDKELAVRIALWARDIREGAGERQTFRSILKHIESSDPDLAIRLISKIPELGRFDDLLVFETNKVRAVAFSYIKDILVAGLYAFHNDVNGNELFLAATCSKWMPREKSSKSDLARTLMKHFGWSPKYYRKTLALLTDVVETKMCAGDWDKINFSQVPSVASARYKKAFYKNAEQAYSEYVGKLTSGDKSVKVNASAIYPHEVLKGCQGISYGYNSVQKDLILAQWEALPNYVGDVSILPMVDVSGSMECPVGGNQQVSCMDVAVSLGLYLADKNKGAFKDLFLTFSGDPELLHLKGNVLQKCDQMVRSRWGMNTDLHRAFDKVLSTAIKGNVSQDEMPKYILIFSDMQFDRCAAFDDSAYEMIKRKYERNGYVAPAIVFWNLHSHDNVPVKHNEQGVALVSGFSPALLQSILKADLEDFTPEAIMLSTITKSRYDF